MRKVFFLTAVLMCFAINGFTQTKSVEIAKVNQGNWSVVEFIGLETGEIGSVVFYLRDSRFSQLREFFYISFDDRESLVEFLSELSELYKYNEGGIHTQVNEYSITTGKVAGNNYLMISDNGSSGYSNLSKVYFNNLCKALKKKGYEIDFI